jgi:outer membrane lipoprotein-sorting protein
MRKLSVFALFILFFVSNIFSQNVDDVINSHIKALGGLDKLSAIKSIKYTGKFSGGGFEVPVIYIIKRPDKVRMDITFQGNSQIQAYDGTMGWSVNPFQGKKDPEKMTKEREKEMREQTDIDGPMVNYKDKGNKVELMGKEDMEGSEVYKIKLTDKDGDVTYYYLDAGSYLILKETKKRKIGEKEINSETIFGNYQATDGVMFAMAVEFREVGQTEGQKGVIEKIETNIEVEDSYFKMPAIQK